MEISNERDRLALLVDKNISFTEHTSFFLSLGNMADKHQVIYKFVDVTFEKHISNEEEKKENEVLLNVNQDEDDEILERGFVQAIVCALLI